MKLLLLLLFVGAASAAEIPNYAALNTREKAGLQHVAALANRGQTNIVWTPQSYYASNVVAHLETFRISILDDYARAREAAAVETNAAVKVIRSRLHEVAGNTNKVGRIEAILNE